MQVLNVPFQIVFSFQASSTIKQEFILGAQLDCGVRVDGSLEFRCPLRSLCCRILSFLLFLNDFISLFIVLFGRRGWLDFSDKEDFVGCLIADRVTIEDVSSVLAVITAKSPPESLA